MDIFGSTPSGILSPGHLSPWTRRGLILMAGLICIATTLFALAWGAQLILANAPSLQRDIANRVRTALPVPVHFSRLQVDLWPRPSLLLTNLKVTIPRFGPTRADRIQLYPDLGALLRGRLTLDRILVLRPYLTLPSLPALPAGPGPGQTSLMSGISKLQRDLPQGLEVHIRQGTVRHRQTEKPRPLLHDLALRLENGSHLGLSLEAASEILGHLSLQVQTGKQGLHGSLGLQGTRPDVLLRRLPLPRLPIWPGIGSLDADIQFTASSLTDLQARINLHSRQFVLCTRAQERSMQGLALTAELKVHGSTLIADIDQASLGRPQASLSGQVYVDLSQPWVQLHLRGRDFVVPGLRSACVGLFPRSNFLTKLFDILRAGHIPHLSLATYGASPSDLKEAFTLQAQIQDGVVQVPKVDLHLTRVEGTVWVKDQIFNGVEMSAHMDQARGWDGRLKLGLQKDKEKRPFAFSAHVSGSLAPLPSILRKAVKNRAFVQEVNKVEALKGQARAWLDLLKTPQGTEIDIQARTFQARAEHARLDWPVQAQGSNLHITNHSIQVRDLQADLGPSRFQIPKAGLSWQKAPRLTLQLTSGQVDLQSFWPWLQSLPRLEKHFPSQLHLQGRADLEQGSLNLPLRNPEKNVLTCTARVQGVRARHPRLPAELILPSGRIAWEPKLCRLKELRLHTDDARISLSGQAKGRPGHWNQGLSLTLSGRFGPQSAQLGQELLSIPAWAALQGPFSLDQGRVDRGPDQELTFQGRFSFAPDLHLDTELIWTQSKVHLRRCHIQDSGHQAQLTVTSDRETVRVGFSGRLRPAALDRILARSRLRGPQGSLSGTFQAWLNTDPFRLNSATGRLQLHQTEIQAHPEWPPIRVDRASLDSSSGPGLKVHAPDMSWAGRSFALSGQVIPRPAQPVQLDLTVATQSLSWSWIQSRRATLTAEGDDSKNLNIRHLIQGRIQTQVDSFRHQDRVLSPLHLTWDFNQEDRLTVHILDQSSLCGLSLPGKLTLSEKQIHILVSPSARELDLAPGLHCLFGTRNLATGLLNMNGHLQATAADQKALIRNLQGDLDFVVTQGRLLKFNLLAKIIEVLNSTEILFGHLPDLDKQGVSFTRLQGKAVFQGPTVTISQGLVDGKTLEVGFEGTLNTQTQSLDLTVLVAPLKTVDRLIKKIPLISGLTRGNLISIPVRVSGSWRKPRITPMSPQAVSTELVDLMRRTLELPFKIFQPFMGRDHDSK